MAHHKSAKKRIRQTATRNERNSVQTSTMRTVVKKIRTAIEAKDKKVASELLTDAQSKLSKLAKNGVIKANTAARRTSRLAKQIASL